MAWNGSGTYVLNALYNPEVPGTTIDPVRYNGNVGDIAAGITNALAKDGQNVPTANLPMATFKHLNAGSATAAGQYTVYGQAASFASSAFTVASSPAGNVGATYAIAGANSYDYVDSSLSANNRIAGWLWSTGVFFGRFINDAYNIATNWVTVTGGQGAGIASIDLASDLRVTPVVGAARKVQVSGSAAGNPTIGASAGSLALSSPLVDSLGVTFTPMMKAVKPATTSRASTAVLADDPDLVLALPAGQYAFRGRIPVWTTTSGAGGIQVTMQFTGTQTSAEWTMAQAFGAGTMTGTINAALGSTISAGAAGPNGTSVQTGGWIAVEGTLLVTVAGNLKLQWAQNSSNVNALNFGVGGWLSATRLA